MCCLASFLDRRSAVRSSVTSRAPIRRSSPWRSSCGSVSEGQLEGGLVTDLVLDDILDERGTRGLVLYTRMGNRLIIGRPEDQRFGITLEVKARELVHAIRCQGDLTQVAMINVRFGQAFYTLHAPTPPTAGAAAVRPTSSPGAPGKP